MRILYISLLVVAMTLILCASPASAVDSYQEVKSPIPVLVYYYIWFDPGSWDRAKSDLPLLGPYSSDDEQVMRSHIEWAKEVGIDGFIVSWKSTDKLNRRLEQLIKIAEEKDFKLCIIYQGLDFERRPLGINTVSMDLETFKTSYAGSRVFDLFNKPLVIWSGTWEFSKEEISAVVEKYRGELIILASERDSDAYLEKADVVDGNAYYWSSVDPDTFPNYEEKLTLLSESVHKRNGIWIAPAAPGFDARLIGGYRIIDRKNGETLQKEMNAAFASSPDAIGLISWNEFSENTHLEPSRNFGTRSLEVIKEYLGGTLPLIIDYESSEPAETVLEPNYGRIFAFGLMVLLILVSLLVIILRGTASRQDRQRPSNPP
jgi:hypothetical protein